MFNQQISMWHKVVLWDFRREEGRLLARRTDRSCTHDPTSQTPGTSLFPKHTTRQKLGVPFPPWRTPIHPPLPGLNATSSMKPSLIAPTQPPPPGSQLLPSWCSPCSESQWLACGSYRVSSPSAYPHVWERVVPESQRLILA